MVASRLYNSSTTTTTTSDSRHLNNLGTGYIRRGHAERPVHVRAFWVSPWCWVGTAQ